MRCALHLTLADMELVLIHPLCIHTLLRQILLPDYRSEDKRLMELTPVKIRGRHSSTKSKQALVRSKRPADEPATAIGTTSQAKHPRKTKSKFKETIAAMPALEGLPQELLEIVFLYSMNISLPRTSRTLGHKLSSRAVTMEYTMRSFFHTVNHDSNLSDPKRRMRTMPASVDQFSNDKDQKRKSELRLQSDILSCRFYTFEFFMAYVQRARDSIVKQRGEAWEKTGVTVHGTEDFDGLWPFKFEKVAYLSFAEGFHIPEKLLHGPWTTDKASLLFVLVSLNGRIDWEGSMSGETARTGLKEAIKDSNERAVAALSVLLGVPKAITTDMLRYAVINCDCSIAILRHLLFNAQILAHEVSREVLDFYDPSIWAWADIHGEKGRTLKYMLKNAADFTLEFYFEENVDWTKIVSFPYSGSKFDTRTTLDAHIIQELLQNLYKNYGRKITRRRVMPYSEGR